MTGEMLARWFVYFVILLLLVSQSRQPTLGEVFIFLCGVWVGCAIGWLVHQRFSIREEQHDQASSHGE